MKNLSRPQIEEEAKAIKRELYKKVVQCSTECKAIKIEDIETEIKRIIELRKMWLKSK